MLTFLSRILITLVNIPISVLIARTLGPDGQGAYSAVLTFTTIWGTSFLLGIDTAHTYYLAGRRSTLAEVVRHAWIWSLVLGLAATPLYVLAAPWLAGGGDAAFRSVLTLSAFSIPLVVFKYLLLSAFLGEGRIDQFNLFQVISNLALLALVTVLVVFLPGGVRGAVWAYLGSLLVFAILGVAWVARRLGTRGLAGSSWNPEFARRTLVYGLKGHLGSLVGALTYRLDQVFVIRYLGLEAQGLYSVAVLLAEKLSHVPSSIQLVLFPRVSGSTTEEANRLTPTASRLTFFGVLGAAAVLFALSGPLVRLFYGTPFLPALPALRILLPGVVLLAVGKVLAGDLSGRDRRLEVTLAQCAAFLANLALALLWIPRHGIEGAAWASNVAYGLQTAALTFVFTRRTGVSAWKLVIPEREDGARLRRAYQAGRRRLRREGRNR